MYAFIAFCLSIPSYLFEVRLESLEKVEFFVLLVGHDLRVGVVAKGSRPREEGSTGIGNFLEVDFALNGSTGRGGNRLKDCEILES